jgi:hypothetical protein
LLPIERQAHTVLETIRLRDEARRREILERPGCSPCDRPAMDPIYFQTYQYYQARQKEVSDPTTLIVVDEADRLQMNSLEQVRSVFDSGDMGMTLIGMPGIEKRIARFPQLYSRIGFVHEFRPLGAAEVQGLLERCWTPPTPEVVAHLVRMTGGNFSHGCSPRLNASWGSTTPRLSRSKSSRQLETALSSAKPETRRPTTNNSTKATTNNSSLYRTGRS